MGRSIMGEITMKRSIAPGTAAALMFAGLANAQPDFGFDGGVAELGDDPVSIGNGPNAVTVVPVARDLVHPWSLAFLPNGDLLVAELNGNLRLIRNGSLEPDPVWTAPFAGQGGDALKSVAVHPDFDINRLIYVAYGKNDGDRNTLAIAHGQLDGSSLAGVEEIFVADAWETGGNLAGRILFGPDATLYVTIGDRDRLCCQPEDDPSLRLKAQDLTNHVGKTLRINDDGSVPSDNPFVGRSDARPEIFTYGHRNGYGLSFHPETGELWQAEIGPMGGDEINILLPGHNYGWPLVSTGRNYSGSLVSDEPWARPGMDNPRFHWAPSISPSGLLFYTGDRFPRWQNTLFVGGLTTRQLINISFNQPSQAEPRRALLTELRIRVRDIAQSPDGYIYLATERTSGGPEADGRVLRLEPPVNRQ
jgi:glucose/arabinose dehydrogenase